MSAMEDAFSAFLTTYGNSSQWKVENYIDTIKVTVWLITALSLCLLIYI